MRKARKSEFRSLNNSNSRLLPIRGIRVKPLTLFVTYFEKVMTGCKSHLVDCENACYNPPSRLETNQIN
jgi:hypothetical protein